MLFGTAGYIPDTDALENLIKTTFTQPELDEPGVSVIKIQDEEVQKKAEDAPNVKEWPDQY